jgi:hypothetical protein
MVIEGLLSDHKNLVQLCRGDQGTRKGGVCDWRAEPVRRVMFCMRSHEGELAREYPTLGRN